MAIATPPRPGAREEPPAGDPLDALIEEARRRARRRRRRRGAAVVVLGAAVATLVLVGRDDGEVALEAAPVQWPSIAAAPTGAPARNGPLTLMAVREVRPAEGPRGWYGVSTVTADGELRLVARCPRRIAFCGEVESIDWSPDGRRLALSVTSFGLPNPYNGIHVLDRVSGADYLVRRCGAMPGECDWFDLDWSPDGSRLAYVAGGRIAVLDFAPDAVTRRIVPATGTTGAHSSPSWSPDGRRIAYAERVDGRSSVYVVGLDGSPPKLVMRSASAPAWAPTGWTLAVRRGCGLRFVTPTGADVTPRLLRECLPTGAPYRGVRLGPPVWSPDGTQLAVSTFARAPEGRATFVLDADGSHVRLVTRETLDVHVGQQPRPAWRPLR